MDEYKFAIEIKNHANLVLAQAIWPHLREFQFDQLRNQFLVLDDESGKVALYGPGAFAEKFSHIENGPEITVKKLYLK